MIREKIQTQRNTAALATLEQVKQIRQLTKKHMRGLTQAMITRLRLTHGQATRLIFELQRTKSTNAVVMLVDDLITEKTGLSIWSRLSCEDCRAPYIMPAMTCACDDEVISSRK